MSAVIWAINVYAKWGVFSKIFIFASIIGAFWDVCHCLSYLLICHYKYHSRLHRCMEDLRKPCYYLGRYMNVFQYRNFVAFRYYWEYFGICTLVQAIDKDADIESLLPVTIRSISICVNIWATHRCAVVRALLFMLLSGNTYRCQYRVFCILSFSRISQNLCRGRDNIWIYCYRDCVLLPVTIRVSRNLCRYRDNMWILCYRDYGCLRHCRGDFGNHAIIMGNIRICTSIEIIFV